jgi:hypothetical protein
MYRYRVVEMKGNRVALQIVNKATGLPDLVPISEHSGVSGAWSKLQPGQGVLVSFVEGDPSQPVITHFEDKDGAGFQPSATCLDAKDQVMIGTSDLTDSDARLIARVGDAVECFMPPACPVVGTLSGMPFSGVLTVVDPIVGIITSGATKGYAK